MAPATLARLVATKRFTSKKGDLPMVIRLNTLTILSLFGDVEEVSYGDLGWADAEIAQLCQVLPLCTRVMKLILYKNAISDAGLSALASVFAKGALAQVTYLFLQENSIGDEGLSALASACASGALAQLRSLYVGGNPTSQQSKDALKTALGKTQCTVNF